MFAGYESVDEQEWQWIQQERNENGGEKLKVPNRLVKVHASVSDWTLMLIDKRLNRTNILVLSRWMDVTLIETHQFQSRIASVATAGQTIH